jgi:predicted nucleotidyltransferase
MSLQLSENIIESVTDCLKDLPGLVAVYVHGSVVRGTCRPGSDLDLALLFRHDVAIDRVELMHISGELEAVLKIPVHIGILDRNSLVYAKEVIVNGRLIYCRDKQSSDVFSMYCLSGYAELNEQRQRVITSYRA